MSGNTQKHIGRFSQVGIYLGKMFRMFVYQNDWKVLPMSAVIAGLVAFVVGGNLFVTQEGTLLGTFALSCICIWNGFFNSIQNVCRERAIIKREHRSGLHISAYVAAHMIYQAFLCLCQTVITIMVCMYSKVNFPSVSYITPIALVDVGITIFLTTYCADMMSLMISSWVHTTTAAMTVMPFLLIFQLVFSGGFFSLSGFAEKITNVTIAKWGLTALCAQGNYNSLPMVSLWNAILKMRNVEYEGIKPIQEVMVYIENNNYRDQLLLKCAEYNQNAQYASTSSNILGCWGFLILFTVIYATIAVIGLEFIDKDKR